MELLKVHPTFTPISSILNLILLALLQTKNSPKTAKTVQTEYDYVIVGAGSAGAVVASRLSELPCVSVLLLEAGGAPPATTEIPATNRFHWFTGIDWQFKTTPQKNCGSGLKDRQFVFPQGKVLGGSSTLNDVQATRGNSKNYDDWAANGAKGWSFDDVLPYFKKLETNTDKTFLTNGYHGNDGPVTVAKPNYNPNLKTQLFAAAKSLGFQMTDSNGPNQTGLFDLQGPIRNGQLCHTAKAYLVPADDRKNLDILPNARVIKVVITNRTATGVQFDLQKKTYMVKARREVIVSAGVINTPKLLMLSGIGPKEVLEKLDIPIVADLPVGRNLQEHIGGGLNFLLKDVPALLLKLLNPVNLINYLTQRKDIYASAQLVTTLLFGKRNGTQSGNDVPDYEVYFLEASTLIPLMDFNMKPEVFSQIYGSHFFDSFYLCLTHLVHPRSRGTVTINSTDPYAEPVIDPNFLDHPEDIEDIVAGLKTCRRMGESEEMKQLGSRVFSLVAPGCEEYADDEDNLFRCQVKTIPVNFLHAVGTSKMGSPDDLSTVVDPELRVKNVRNLRVVDASIMPTVPTGNPNIPTIMVAEKASDMIKTTIQC